MVNVYIQLLCLPAWEGDNCMGEFLCDGNPVTLKDITKICMAQLYRGSGLSSSQ